jgi:hypothetical protein
MPDKNGKWTSERKALKKIQLHFNFQQEQATCLQHDAINHGIKPSDMIRKIINLPYKKIQRPRIGISFDEHEINFLAQKYGLGACNETDIKRRVTEEVNVYYSRQKES